MNPNWLGTACAVVALMAFYGSHRIAAGWSSRRRALLSTVSTLLSIPGASFAVHYLHVVPETSGYFEFRSWRGTEALLVLLGFAGGAIATLVPRRYLVAPLLGTSVLAFSPVLKPFVRPIPSDTLVDRWVGAVCLQSTASTCGPASVATVLKQHRVDVAERELAREAHSYLGGTEAWYLARCIRKRGCEARFYMSSGWDDAIPLPAVAGVRIDSAGHFIALLSREGDRIRVGDPLHGPEELTRDELTRRYTFTGFFMGISRPRGRTTASPD
ncbi:MAG: hypothetical protein JNL97_07425 [Verrucomicrobiales bacterium]|nr:hypothetical protein [Verrucomicrobiales bacterium]